jgi:thioredoxin 1
MLERIVVAVALVGLGVLAYHILLSAQRRSAANALLRQPPAARPELLIFTSPTCAPCKLQQMPIVDQLMAVWSDRVETRVVDVTEQPEVAAKYSVWSLPTTIVIDAAGHVAAINQGVASEQKLRQQLERVAANPSTRQQTNPPVVAVRPGGRG